MQYIFVPLTDTRYKRHYVDDSSLSTVSMLGFRDNIHFTTSFTSWCLSAGLFLCHVFGIWIFFNNHSVCAIFSIYDFILCNIFYWYQIQPKIKNERQQHIGHWMMKQFVLLILSPFLPIALSMQRYNYDVFKYPVQKRNNNVKSKNKRTRKRRKKNKALKNKNSDINDKKKQTTSNVNNTTDMCYDRLLIWQAIIQVELERLN